MKYQIDGNPDQGQLTVQLDPGETFMSQAGAMSFMHSHIEITPRMIGGLVTGMIRKVFGGESLFLSEYSAPTAPGAVTMAPVELGSISVRELKGDTLLLTKGAYLASSPEINIATRFGGFKSLFSGEGAFLVECSGHGLLFFNSYGAVIEREINGEITVDTGHLVAFEPTLDYVIGGMGSWKSTLLSGEGLVMKFSGQGKIYLQTRTLGNLAGWLTPYCR